MTDSLSVRSQHIFPFFSLTAVVVCSQTWPPLCVFHRTLPCSVGFLWGFEAPVTVLLVVFWSRAGIELGGRIGRGQMALAVGQKTAKSQWWYDFLRCLLKSVSRNSKLESFWFRWKWNLKIIIAVGKMLNVCLLVSSGSVEKNNSVNRRFCLT